MDINRKSYSSNGGGSERGPNNRGQYLPRFRGTSMIDDVKPYRQSTHQATSPPINVPDGAKTDSGRALGSGQTNTVKTTKSNLHSYQSFPKVFLRRKIVYLAAPLIIILAVFGVVIVGYDNDKDTNQATVAGHGSTLAQSTPDYKTILPKGKNIESLGGWSRVSPVGSEPVFAYVDNIDGVKITVSEQRLPSNFESNVGASVAQIASTAGADIQLEANGVNVHIAESGNGAQSIIFAKEGVLVFIRSSSSISNGGWVDYIASLD